MNEGAPNYVRSSSFEAGTVIDWAVSDDAVALLRDDATVQVVADGRDSIDLPDGVDGVALGQQLFVGGNGSVEAYARSGTRLWKVDLEEVVQVAAPGDSDFVVALTDGDELVGLDAVSGQERFRFERPHADVSGTPELVCTDDALVVGAWSFLSVLGPRGESRLAKTLDGAINGIGVVGDTIVCVMKHDHCVGIDRNSGERLWSNDWTVDRIDPFGHEELFVRTVDDVRVVRPDGSWESLDLESGHPVAATQGSPLCVVGGSLVTVYQRVSGDAGTIDATIDADSLSADSDSLPVTVRNRGDAAVGAGVTVELTGGTLTTESRSVSLPAGDRERLGFDLESIDEDEVEAVVRVDDEQVLERTLSVSAGVGVLEIDTEFVSATPDGTTVDVVIANDSAMAVEGVSVDPPHTTVDVIPPGGTERVAVEFRDDRRTVTVTDSSGGDGIVEVSAPESPLSVTVDDEDGLVVVSVRNDTDGTVADTVVVESELLPTDVRREIEGGPGSRFDLLASPTATGPASVTVTGTFLDARKRLEFDADDVAAPTADGPATTAAGGPDADPGAGPGGAEPRPELLLDRRIEPSTFEVGRIVVECVDVTNDGDTPAQVVVDSDDRWPPASMTVSPGETVTVGRPHTVTVSEGATIPAVTVDGGAEEYHADDIDVDASYPDFSGVARLDERNGQPVLDVKFVNESRVRKTVTDLSLRSYRLAEPFDGETFQPGEERLVSVPLDGPTVAEFSDPEMLSYTVSDAETEGVTERTLVEVPEVDDSGIGALSFAIDDETTLDENSGTVVLEVANDGDHVLDAVTMEAYGGQVREILYQPEVVEEFRPGDVLYHYVDVVGSGAGLELPIDVEVTVNGHTSEETITVVDDGDCLRVEGANPEAEKSIASTISMPFTAE